MNRKVKILIPFILAVGVLFIHFYSRDQSRVEWQYSNGFFPSFSFGLRHLLGGIPFSIGDFLYGFFIGWLIYKLVKFVAGFVWYKKQKPGYNKVLNGFFSLFILSSSLYIIFNIFWGINYNRKGIAWQLGLDMHKYSTEDLKEINCELIDKINLSKNHLLNNNRQYPTNANLYRSVTRTFSTAEKSFPFLKYHPPSIKTSMWGWLGNYTGFTGYYNPFTGEAQLNTTVPKFLQPFIACHEVAHQLGYAKEMEANFVGYLAASASPDTMFHYSVYLDLFTYANRNLFLIDSSQARIYRKELIEPVQADLKAWRDFRMKHINPIEPVIRWIYGKFLQGNEQPQGILSYDEVTAFIIAYYKKFGYI